VLDDADDAVRFWIRQRTQQNGFHYAEDGGGGSNPERQRDDHDGREPWTTQQLSDRVTDVLAHPVPPGVMLIASMLQK
jgi:hypothetical protein